MILAVDIGGTKTLLGLFETATLVERFTRRYASTEFATFDALLVRALADAASALGAAPAIDGACIGVAGPLTGDRAKVTHLPWEVDASALARRFAIPQLRLINDFTANAYGIDMLTPEDLAVLQPGSPVPAAPRVLIGAGTGLGIAYLVHDGRGYRPVASEAGHAGFAPADAMQARLWSALSTEFGRVECEHVVSGPGLARIYAFLGRESGRDASSWRDPLLAATDAPAAITRLALEQRDPLAGAALDLFVACYGAVAGDHALGIVARGGVYLCGGIAPKLQSRLADGSFIRSFNAKGSFADLTRAMPVWLVRNERVGLLGAARAAMAP